MRGRVIYFCIIIIMFGINNKFLHYLGSIIINHFHHYHQHSVHYHHHHLPAASCRNVWTNKDKMPHWQVHHHLHHHHHHRHQCDHLHHLGCKADEGQTRGQFATARGSLTCNWNPAVRSCSAPTNNTTHHHCKHSHSHPNHSNSHKGIKHIVVLETRGECVYIAEPAFSFINLLKSAPKQRCPYT